MKFPSRSILRSRWKTILATLLIAISGFSLGTFANRVVVQQVQSIGGNHVTVPAPELKVLNTIWNTELNSSRVTGLILNLTTTGASGATGSKLYQVEVQVSCLTGTTVSPNCAVGTTLVTLPVNMNGAAVLIPVSISPSIDPETTEIDDLSFIVTGAPADLIMNFCHTVIVACWTGVPPPLPPKPDFALFAQTSTGGPLTLPLPTATVPGGTSSVSVTKVVASLGGYAGVVTLAAIAPPVLSVTFSTNPVLVPANGAVTSTETITATTATPPGLYVVVNEAFDCCHFHTFPVFVNVV